MLVTERPGRLRIVGTDGRLSEPLSGVPKVYASGQGGLLDVALSPTFDKDRVVYLSFAESGEGGAGTAVARGQLGERGLENTQVIWRQQPKVSGSNHWGSRIVFRLDGTLFVTLGERFNHSEKAQDLSVTLGKVVRINSDGSAPRGGCATPGDGTALDRGARRARRRRAEPSGSREKLRLAGHLLRHPLLLFEDRRRHGETGDGLAGLLLGSGDRAVRHGHLHGRTVRGLEKQLSDRLAHAGRIGASRHEGRQSRAGRTLPGRSARAHPRRTSRTGRLALFTHRRARRPDPADNAADQPLRKSNKQIDICGRRETQTATTGS